MSGWNVSWRGYGGLFNIPWFFPCVIDNTSIRGNIFHRILEIEGKFSTLGGEDAGGTGEQKTPSPEELSQLVRELIAAVPWGYHANVLAKLADRAAAVIFAHNHPSGDLQPSEADRRTHEQLTEAAKILGLRVIDHVIVSKKGYFSFQENGLIR